MTGTGSFGLLVKRYRQAAGLSQEQLAQKAGLSNGMISLLETGQRGERPRRDTVIALAQALGAPLPAMLRAAGLLKPGDPLAPETGRPSFAAFVQGEPGLTTAQKRILVQMFDSWTR